jgi:hypothetical protein
MAHSGPWHGQAIAVRFHGPTNYRGSRYTATAQAGRVTVTADDSLNSDENYRAAALALCAKFAWTNTDKLVGGVLKDGTHVFVFAGPFYAKA